MAFMGSALSAIGNGAQAALGTSALSSGAGAAASGAASSGLSGASGGLGSMLESMPMGMGGGMGLFSDASKPASNGFLSGAVDSLGVATDGKYDPKKAGGLVGSLLGQAATSPSEKPSMPDIQMANFPQAIQQALGEKPWATSMYDTYIKQLMGGG